MAALASKGTQETKVAGDSGNLAEVQQEIDRLAARLCGLSEAELKDIKD